MIPGIFKRSLLLRTLSSKLGIFGYQNILTLRWHRLPLKQPLKDAIEKYDHKFGYQVCLHAESIDFTALKKNV